MAVRSTEQDGSAGETGVVRGRATVDWAVADPVLQAVLDALAEAIGADVTDLDPVYEYVDPDALTALLRSASRSPPPAVTAVRFTYGEYTVVVRGDGDVIVREH